MDAILNYTYSSRVPSKHLEDSLSPHSLLLKSALWTILKASPCTAGFLLDDEQKRTILKNFGHLGADITFKMATNFKYMNGGVDILTKMADILENIMRTTTPLQSHQI